MSDIRKIEGIKIHKTRFAELGFFNNGRNDWRFVTAEDGEPVGTSYASKDELLADLGRYAAFYGCEGAL